MTRKEAAERIKAILEECTEYEDSVCYVTSDDADALNTAIKALEQEPCEDCISREQAKLAIRDRFKDLPSRVEINTILNELPSVTHIHKDRIVHDFVDKCRGCGKHKWIPFTTRPLTEEEKEEHSEWDGILDCKLPDDGQRILVSISVRGHECVQYDEFYMDDGCYLDSGYEICTEAVAWMPLPEPYKERREE